MSDTSFTKDPLAMCGIMLDAARQAIPELAAILRPTLSRAGSGLKAGAEAAQVATQDVAARIVGPVSASVRDLAARTPLSRMPVDAVPASIIGSWYAYAAVSDPDQLPYDLSFWRAQIGVVGTALSAWLGLRRSAASLPVGLATAAITAGLSSLQVARHGTYVTRTWEPGSWRDVAFNQVMPLLHGAALPLSVLGAYATGPALATRAARLVPEALRSRWPKLRTLGLYYMVFSILGHWGEMLFCTGIKHGLICGGYDRENHMLWDQWLFPFPAEGTAAVLMALFLYPAKNAIEGARLTQVARQAFPTGLALGLSVAATFLLNQAVCTSIDYATGLVANQNYELWDYRDMPFNFQGQVCLQNSLVYTGVATWAVWRLFPRMEALMAMASDAVLDGAFVALGSFFAFLELLYHVVPPKREVPEGEQPRPAGEDQD